MTIVSKDVLLISCSCQCLERILIMEAYTLILLDSRKSCYHACRFRNRS